MDKGVTEIHIVFLVLYITEAHDIDLFYYW